MIDNCKHCHEPVEERRDGWRHRDTDLAGCHAMEADVDVLTMKLAEPTPRAEYCCDDPYIEAIAGMGSQTSRYVTVACLNCGMDFLVIGPAS